MKRRRPVVAIDGPAGAGKSTVTQRVAEALGYTLVDTGALYRAVALCGERRQISWDDAERLGQLAQDLAERGAIHFEPGRRLFVDGDDVTEAIRTQHISEGASRVSALPPVRQGLLELQRQAGSAGGVVLEGRDIGTVVFPDAEVKFFLTASMEVRARRRYEELQRRGQPADLTTVQREVEERDRRDASRSVAPLVAASDARVVDSSQLSIDQVVELMVEHTRDVERRLGGSA